ncbi:MULTISPECIES: glycosyltransferase family 4 protein [unclassified Pseudomonas]|uniref:glycosyltransferase family 4 protein n=1 Tax=unclassified Pseudomonas TaxID=196821 RepID=UPI0008716A12|nr:MULTISPECIES: glycosyltransferase family 4 protein [unclassified Pseudomonas]SCW62879.1 Glycosyltransferase involved in cell wall bisynthesis [Pseudomonas sp. NFACC05-1]SFL61044.1 Glycosyltransferase involved in cell wall bisynthesis [Pseudomonas sp. NFACC46-3]
MKIVYVITRSDTMGGASVHVLDLASGAQKAGHEVIILVGGKGVLVARANKKNIPVISLKFLIRNINLFKDVFAFFELRKYIKDIEPDLIHLHSSKVGILGRLVAKSLGIPVIFTAHGWAFTEGVSAGRRKFYKAVERVMAFLASRIITVSNYDRKIALSSGVGDEGLICTVHNGMPALELDSTIFQDTASPKMIMVARFDEQKDQVGLVRALALLQDISWTLEFVGDGPSICNIKQLVKQFGLEGRVLFSGACDDIPERLNNSQIFLLITNWEGFPLTILEAMRAGLPVIASDVGGVSEAVQDGCTGILVSRNDINNLAEAIRSMLGSSEMRRAMGAAGKERFEKAFLFDGMLDKTLSIYRDVLK